MERTVAQWRDLADYFDYTNPNFANYIHAELNRRTIGIVPSDAFREAVLERERTISKMINHPKPNTFEHNYERYLGDS